VYNALPSLVQVIVEVLHRTEQIGEGTLASWVHRNESFGYKYREHLSIFTIFPFLGALAPLITMYLRPIPSC
jgi:hypothetical protein